MNGGIVISVASAPGHAFSKQAVAEMSLITGLGVAGDAHAGETVRHRSRVARDPTQPNLRQVHLLHAELFDELAPLGFALKPGEVSDVVTTQFGYHVIKVTDHKPAGAVPLEQVSDRVKQFLAQQKKQQQADTFITALKQKSKIEVLV